MRLRMGKDSGVRLHMGEDVRDEVMCMEEGGGDGVRLRMGEDGGRSPVQSSPSPQRC